MISSSPILLSKWSSSLSLKKGEVTKVPMWVKLYNVPILAYSGDGLSLIAMQRRKPIMLDAFTSSMCVESWGRISFARALIEVGSDYALKKEVVMAITNEEGTDYVNEVIREAPKALPTAATRPIFMENQEDGFVEVTGRRNKGKRAANQQANNPIAGIRIHEPKSSFYRPINKHGTNKQPKNKPTDIRNASTSHNYGEKSTSISNGDTGDGTNVTTPSRAKPGLTTLLSNPFDVLSAVEEDVCGPSDQNPKESEHVGYGSSNIDAEKGQEKDSLWSHFKEAKEASRSNPRTTMSDSDGESEAEEYPPYDCTVIFLTGGGFSLYE
nr:hypothetical protein [Tanacetum cinerariifolium]